jgi:hypothetical protein
VRDFWRNAPLETAKIKGSRWCDEGGSAPVHGIPSA